MVVPALSWFEQYAIFRVPHYEFYPSSTPSSSGIRSGYAERLHTSVPHTAAYDSDKVDRLLHAARQALQNQHLVSPGRSTVRDSDIQRAYAELFSPAVETKYDVMYDAWKQIFSERDCQHLTQNALLYAIRFVVNKMFKRELTTCSEPRNPDNIFASEERADFSVKKEDGQCLYLVESTTPLVLEAFEEYIRDEYSLQIDLRHAGVGEEVLNKSIKCMCLHDCDHLVLSSFEKVYFFERFRHTQDEYILSYSGAVLQDRRSEVFLALLGLTLSRLNVVSLDGPPRMDFDERGYLYFRVGPGGSPGPSGGSERKTGGHNLHPNAGKRFLAHRTGKGKGDTSTKRRRKINALQVSSPKDHDITDIRPRFASRQEKTVEKDTGSIIKVLGGEFIRYDERKELEFELVPGVKFPCFPTSDEVPVLRIIEDLGEGATGLACKAELLRPSNCDDVPFYAVKLVDTAWRCPDEYRNVVKDLHQEYVNYCILELGKKYPALKNMIRRCMATCYGLYSLRNPPYSSPKFVLITEYCGDRVKSWKELGNGERCAVMNSLICLHALGLEHNDILERNVVFDKKTAAYRFIDLGTSEWHKCRGIRPYDERPCKELQIMCRKLGFPRADFPLEDQPAVSYEKPPMFLKGHDLRSFLECGEEVDGEKLDVEKLATSVSQLAKELDPEM